MESIFASGVLDRLAACDLLLALDFDGTLAPIVEDPSRAEMRGTTRRLLAEVARRYPCAVISGRPEEDVLRLLSGVTVWYVIGNRALRSAAELERVAAQVRAWRPILDEELARVNGVTLEDKGVSLAIHYRHAADPEAARAAIAAAAARLQAVRLIEGKQVVNLLPLDGPTKAHALDRLRRQLGTAETLYAADDATDEDAFALDGVTGVRVGAAPSRSAARFFLRDQGQVDDLLETLVALRPRASARPEAARRPAPRRYDLE